MGPWDALESGRSRNRAVIAECSLASGESRRFHSGTVAAITQILNEINYEMVRQLAEGGMGVVYEAHQLGAGQFRKTVAVKLIREEYSAIPEFQKNFIGEARLVADLIHTNIVQTYHLGQIGGQYFMVMEYVNGVRTRSSSWTSTAQLCAGRFPVDLAAFIVSRVARGLTYAHQKRDRDGHHLNIVHRDVNPKNILIGLRGRREADGLRHREGPEPHVQRGGQGDPGQGRVSLARSRRATRSPTRAPTSSPSASCSPSSC
jgi:serine/threonine protein kinase